MTNGSNSKSPGSHRLKHRHIITGVLAIAFILFAIWTAVSGFWPVLHDYTWRSEVKILGASLQTADAVFVNVAACNADPKILFVRETDSDVRISIKASSWPFRGGADDCDDSIVVQLQDPLGHRQLIDNKTGKSVRVNTSNLSTDQGNAVPVPDVAPPEIHDPPSEAELQDLQRIADQKGITLQEAIDRYGWNDNFSMLVGLLRQNYARAIADAKIEESNTAWIAFNGPAPQAAIDEIELFNDALSGVTVEIREGAKFTASELEKAIPAAHYAIYESPDVRDATTSFDHETGWLTTTVILKDTASATAISNLRNDAVLAIIDATSSKFFENIRYTIIRSDLETLGGLD